MNDRLREIWLSHYSIEQWCDVSAWSGYLSEVEIILGAKLTHLDSNDPIRKKVASLNEAAEYICSFEENHEARWLFGKFGKIGVSFTIHHHCTPRHLPNHFPNSMKWYFPAKYLDVEDNAKCLKGLFGWGNQFFSPFWGYVDYLEYITAKKKKSRFAVNIETELLGIFWLNYFNAAYVAFFGEEKFNSFPEVIAEKNGGLTACLGSMPSKVPNHLREKLVDLLGKDSFVNPEDLVDKLRGKYVLTFEQLREASKI